jgi:hypothetical protein
MSSNKSSTSENNLENSQTTWNNLHSDFTSMGYTSSEASHILNNYTSRIGNDDYLVANVDIEDLITHLNSTNKFKKYPKSTLVYLISIYNKKNKHIVINQDFYNFIQENIESVDQELWVRDNLFLTKFDEQSTSEIYMYEDAEQHEPKDDHNKPVDIEHTTNKQKTVIHKKQDYRNLIAGFISSSLSRTVGSPLDRLKMLYQVNYIGAKTPPSMLNGLKEIYRSEGAKGFFKGNLINILKGSPENGIKLYTFELTKWKLQCLNSHDKLSKGELFMAGALSGVVSTTVIFPLEVLKMRIAASAKGTYSSISDALVKIYREPRGLINFYSGLEASICSAIPNAGLNLSVYETLKVFYSGKNSIDNASYLSTSMLMYIGGLSALISSTILYPLQIVQARMIMYNLKMSEMKLLPIKNSFLNRYKFPKSIYTSWKLEGIAGFYKGYVPGITKIVIGNAIGFGIYEKTRIFLGVNKIS